MRRATKIRAAGSFDASGAVDRVVLDADERHRRRIVLDDGAIVAVAGRPEPLVEIEAPSPLDLVRLAWHLGNRHTQVQIVGTKLRIRRDRVLESMLAGLGAKLTPIEAPFEPEAGAHAHAQGEYDHDYADHEHGA